MGRIGFRVRVRDLERLGRLVGTLEDQSQGMGSTQCKSTTQGYG